MDNQYEYIIDQYYYWSIILPSSSIISVIKITDRRRVVPGIHKLDINHQGKSQGRRKKYRQCKCTI